MDIAIIYASQTGNTKMLANAIKEELDDDKIVYFGKSTLEIPTADLYFVGSWTDKGQPNEDIINVLKSIKHKKIAYFGTAGFGGSQEYYHALFEKVKKYIDDSNCLLGAFYCQGKMPMQVKERYTKMLALHPDDERIKMSLQNFEEAIEHPNADDIKRVKEWANKVRHEKE